MSRRRKTEICVAAKELYPQATACCGLCTWWQTYCVADRANAIRCARAGLQTHRRMKHHRATRNIPVREGL